jgi:hypothetical protein
VYHLPDPSTVVTGTLTVFCFRVVDPDPDWIRVFNDFVNPPTGARKEEKGSEKLN